VCPNRRSALEEMIQQNATQKLFRQEFLKGTYDLMKVLYYSKYEFFLVKVGICKWVEKMI
jgi:hypothetical protein